MTADTSNDPAAGVTLANWRLAPYSTWSFHNVESLVPVARIAAGPAAWRFSDDPHPIDEIPFEDQDGRERRVGEVLDATFTRGLVALRGGNVVAERYGQGYDGTRPHIVFSVTKSFAGALAGILVNRGTLDPDAAVTKYVPEVAGSAYGDCTVRHVLDMTVSSSFIEDYTDPTGGYARYRRAMLWNPVPPGTELESLHAFLCTMPRGEEPHGKVFHYLSPNSDMLGWLLERASGRSFQDLLTDELWRPMGAEAPAQITVDKDGSARTGGGLCLLPRDLARFGELMQLYGIGNGLAVIPKDWVTDIRQGGDSAPWRAGDMAAFFPQGRYRSQWYQTGNHSGAFCAIGIHGQWLWIDPEREVVIAKVSAQPDPIDAAIDDTLVRAFDALAQAL